MNAFCILFSNSFDNIGLEGISGERTIASVPFGARYRLVDFILSSLVGAQIRDIGIITGNKYGSLMDHVGWGKDWDLNRKKGGIKFLTPFLRAGGNEIEVLDSVINYIKTSPHEYCLLCDSNVVSNIDLKKLINYHKEKCADITFVCKEMRTSDKELEVMLDKNGRLIDTLYHNNSHSEKNIQLGIMVMKKHLLVSLIEKGMTYGWQSIKKNVIAHGFRDYKIYGYNMDGYTSVIKSVEDYYRTNMDLLDTDVRLELFHSKNPILTRIKDTVPTTYGDGASITNSLIADGCSVDGRVENCVIFREVKIKKGAEVKNSIIMQGTVIEENAVISGVITDKDVTVSRGRILAGTPVMPFIINKGKIV